MTHLDSPVCLSCISILAGVQSTYNLTTKHTMSYVLSMLNNIEQENDNNLNMKPVLQQKRPCFSSKTRSPFFGMTQENLETSSVCMHAQARLLKTRTSIPQTQLTHHPFWAFPGEPLGQHCLHNYHHHHQNAPSLLSQPKRTTWNHTSHWPFVFFTGGLERA